MINFWYIADGDHVSAVMSDLGDYGAIVSLLPGNALMMEGRNDVLGCKVKASGSSSCYPVRQTTTLSSWETALRTKQDRWKHLPLDLKL